MATKEPEDDSAIPDNLRARIAAMLAEPGARIPVVVRVLYLEDVDQCYTAKEWHQIVSDVAAAERLRQRVEDATCAEIAGHLRRPGATLVGVARKMRARYGHEYSERAWREAVSDVSGAIGVERTTGPARGARRPDLSVLNEADLRRMHLDECLNDSEIAARFGVSKQAVWAARKRWGIQRE